MALVTYLWLPVGAEYRIVCNMNFVASGTSHVITFMNAAVPGDALLAFMAFQA